MDAAIISHTAKRGWYLLIVLAGLFLGGFKPAWAAPAITLDQTQIIEYWLWAEGVKVDGTGYAATSNISVVLADPAGGTRVFATTSDAQGNFSVQANAMRIDSILGIHTVTATDALGGTAQAQLLVTADPNEVLQVTTSPTLQKFASFSSDGNLISVSGLVPNTRIRVNIFSPSENGGELMAFTPQYSDANGNYSLLINPLTEIFGWDLRELIPIEGVWRISAQSTDASGESIWGNGSFRLTSGSSSVNQYCAVEMMDTVEPITYVNFAGIDNLSPVDSTAAHESFTTQHGTVMQGRSYLMRLQGKATWSFNANTYTVFVDWNQNGLLDEDNEIYWAGSLLGSTGTDGMEVSYQLPVPSNAKPGRTRMRILKVYSPSSFAMFWPTGSCGNYHSGQAEDYALEVVEASLFRDGFEKTPTLTKAFSPAGIALDGNSSLTLTLSNPNDIDATLLEDLVDQFPVGMFVAGAAQTTCQGGPGVTQGNDSVTLLAGATIPALGTCTVVVPVTATQSGPLINLLPPNSLQTTVGNNVNSVSAILSVADPIVPPTLSKQFSVTSTSPNTPFGLTITLTNPNNSPAVLSQILTDNFPVGMVSAASASTTCVGGSGISQTGTSVALQSMAVIPANGSCVIHVDVAATTAGSLTNVLPAGALETNHGANINAATATVSVLGAPSVSKQFASASVATNTPVRLTITLTNPTASAATLTADLVDSFPSGLVSAAGASSTCGNATILQTGTSVGLQAGATIPASGSCTIGVDVAATTSGVLTNTIPAGGLVTNQGNNAAAASATLSVQGPPSVSKQFASASVPTNTPVRLTITLTNPNTSAATLSADLMDNFPSGMVSAAGASSTCGSASILQTGTSVGLQAGAIIPASGSCTIGVDVAATTTGALTNTIPAGGLVTSEGNNAAAASATLTVTGS